MYPNSGVVEVRQISWPHVVLLSFLSFCLLTAVVILALADKDVGAILTAVTAFLIIILGALGFSAKSQIESKVDSVAGKADQARDAANGNQTRLMMMVERLQTQVTDLALRVPAPPPLDQPSDNDPKV